MAEWSNAAVLKTVEGHTSGGSNPSLSAARLPSERSKWRRSKEAVMNNSGFGFGLMVEWLQFHPVTVRGTGSNPVETANNKLLYII